jgi:hypothetical protein
MLHRCVANARRRAECFHVRARFAATRPCRRAPRSDVLAASAAQRWEPTLDIELDVHEVCAHPTDPHCAIAATAAGLCISRDAGRSWTVERRGLHALHCASVGFVGADILVGCASDQFAAQGAVYRRHVAGDEPLERVGRGLPEWTDGIVDTRGIASHGTSAALVDRGGDLYLSLDDGRSWSLHHDGLPVPSSVLIVPAMR